MAAIRLAGYVKPPGQLEVDLPDDFPSAAVTVTLDVESLLPTWTDEEIAPLLRPTTPKTGAEIVERLLREPMGGEDVEDGATWVEKPHQKRREPYQW
ncbi:MAG: hypothetical protein SGI73_21260 [Chloroflexota bacterium]|nr:hypothetical protein [Chloroflexota bacterium]